ncbi:hypothetical protein D9756_009660 [Leucocoprinus leucothites]|uniref:Uncharacterized protein n=1 Tax=Leucocoprinus leucothites TaxID=201217 RepID=A0A8H5CWN2_9AGAR|nr:hypothetical protein D9756_009660 [Leucoagaricus leucothites]
MDNHDTRRSGIRYSHLEHTSPDLKPVIRPKSVPSLAQSHHTARATSLNPAPRHKWGIYGRVVVFILFETSFLIFAYYCLLHPISLQSDPRKDIGVLFWFSLTELKAGITAVSVVWHTLACLFIKDIVATVCSAEFMAQYRRLQGMKPGKSDRVSIITSGFVDNLVHFFGSATTREFRLAFLTMLVSMTIGPAGSGTITIGTTLARVDERVSVANLTTLTTLEDRVSLTMRLKKIENTIFGYNLSSSDVFIPWPDMDMSRLPEQSTLVYRSDIVHFDYQCSWLTNMESYSFIDWGEGLTLNFNINKKRYYTTGVQWSSTMASYGTFLS